MSWVDASIFFYSVCCLFFFGASYGLAGRRLWNYAAFSVSLSLLCGRGLLAALARADLIEMQGWARDEKLIAANALMVLIGGVTSVRTVIHRDNLIRRME